MNIELTEKESLILQVIAKNEIPGLQIAKDISELTQGSLELEVYTPILHSLEKRQLIKSRYGDKLVENRSGARHRLYKLTKKYLLCFLN